MKFIQFRRFTMLIFFILFSCFAVYCYRIFDKQNQTNKKPKAMKKIAAGYYEGNYNGVSFTISKSQWDDKSINWYFQIGDNPADDVYSKKSIAIKAAKNFIDNFIK